MIKIFFLWIIFFNIFTFATTCVYYINNQTLDLRPLSNIVITGSYASTFSNIQTVEYTPCRNDLNYGNESHMAIRYFDNVFQAYWDFDKEMQPVSGTIYLTLNAYIFKYTNTGTLIITYYCDENANPYSSGLSSISGVYYLYIGYYLACSKSKVFNQNFLTSQYVLVSFIFIGCLIITIFYYYFNGIRRYYNLLRIYNMGFTVIDLYSDILFVCYLLWEQQTLFVAIFIMTTLFTWIVNGMLIGFYIYKSDQFHQNIFNWIEKHKCTIQSIVLFSIIDINLLLILDSDLFHLKSFPDDRNILNDPRNKEAIAKTKIRLSISNITSIAENVIQMIILSLVKQGSSIVLIAFIVSSLDLLISIFKFIQGLLYLLHCRNLPRQEEPLL